MNSQSKQAIKKVEPDWHKHLHPADLKRQQGADIMRQQGADIKRQHLHQIAKHLLADQYFFPEK